MAKLTVPIIVKWDDIEEDLAKGNIVRVIRCKDCKAYRNCKCVKNNMIAVRDSDFCSRAERKEE